MQFPGSVNQTLRRIKSVQEFHEKDTDQGVERTYLYYKCGSTHFNTDKQEVDILESPKWGKMLFLNGVLQSTSMDEIIYHTALVHPLLDTLQKKSKILILGGGEGATAREVLRWQSIDSVVMVDYDRELVLKMKEIGYTWSRGAFNDKRLRVIFSDAWEFMKSNYMYDGIIIDLTDPDLKKERWLELLTMVMESIKKTNGGFVMNAGLYLPWKTDRIVELINIVQSLCEEAVHFRFYVYTTFIPSFNGEWTFIVVSHYKKLMLEPEFMDIIPDWIRRSIRMLPLSILNPIDTNPFPTPLT
jgi:spermidine synthase